LSACCWSSGHCPSRPRQPPDRPLSRPSRCQNPPATGTMLTAWVPWPCCSQGVGAHCT